MGELTQRMADIRRKAEASEAMVQEICRDIRKLDRAKGHLQITITSLRRLAMLVDAVGKQACACLASITIMGVLSILQAIHSGSMTGP